MLDASSWRVWTSSPAPPPPRCGCVSFPESESGSRTPPDRFWAGDQLLNKTNIFSQTCNVEWVISPKTWHMDGRDREGKCGLSGAACTLVQSSTLSMLSTRSKAPVSLKAMCVCAVAISGFVVWALEMHAAVFSTIVVSAWLTPLLSALLKNEQSGRE